MEAEGEKAPVDLFPSKVLRDITIESLKSSIESKCPFRYILPFNTKEEALRALEIARLSKPDGTTLFYRSICFTKDKKWRLYISNCKMQTYMVLK